MVIFFMVLSFGRLAEAIYSMFGRLTPGIHRLNACKSHEEAHLVLFTSRDFQPRRRRSMTVVDAAPFTAHVTRHTPAQAA
jgi:hypothetical protein